MRRIAPLLIGHRARGWVRLSSIATISLALIQCEQVGCESTSKAGLGPTGPNVGAQIADLVITPVSVEITTAECDLQGCDLDGSGNDWVNHFTQPIVATITAVDADGRPVKDAQNGITVEIQLPFIVRVTDAPDPDNAVIQVTIAAVATDWEDEFGARVLTWYYSPSSPAGTGVRSVGFYHNSVDLRLEPEQHEFSDSDNVFVHVGQTLAASATLITESGAPETGADNYILYHSITREGIGTTGVARFVEDAGEPSGDGILRGRIEGRAVGRARILFLVNNPHIIRGMNVRVVPAVARLEFVPPGRLALQPGEQRVVQVRALDGAGNPVAGADALIEFVSNNGAVASIVARDDGPSDGVVSLTVRATGPGSTLIDATYPGLAAVASLGVDVAFPPNVPAGIVVSTESFAAVGVGAERVLEASVRNPADGSLVPNSDPFVTATSTDQTIVQVLSKDEGTPNDGVVTFRVRGVAAGNAQIRYHYPNAADATTNIQVNP